MIKPIFELGNYQAAKKMMDGNARSPEGLAANLANVETPGYKRIDIDPRFHTEFRKAMQEGDFGRVSHLRPALQIDRDAVAQNRDGNTVQLESELMLMNKNSLEHSLRPVWSRGPLKHLNMPLPGVLSYEPYPRNSIYSRCA